MIHKWVRKRSQGIIIMLVEYGFHTCSLARFHVTPVVWPPALLQLNRGGI